MRGSKGNRTSAEVIAGAKISREIFRKIERGQSVKLKTLRAISNFLGLNQADWLTLVIAWVRLETGDDSRWIEISSRINSPPKDEPEISRLLTRDRMQAGSVRRNEPRPRPGELIFGKFTG